MINNNITDIYFYETDKGYKKLMDEGKFLNDVNDELKDLMSYDDIIKLLDEIQIEENKDEDKVSDEVKSLEEFLK